MASLSGPQQEGHKLAMPGSRLATAPPLDGRSWEARRQRPLSVISRSLKRKVQVSAVPLLRCWSRSRYQPPRAPQPVPAEPACPEWHRVVR